LKRKRQTYNEIQMERGREKQKLKERDRREGQSDEAKREQD